MHKTLIIGIRPSPLAIKQAEEAAAILKTLCPGSEFSIKKIFTSGDKDKTTPLSEVQSQDFFTKEIDDALLAKEIDAAVHSSKDLPDILPDGLFIAWQTEPISRHDALVSRGNIKFYELPNFSRIGASSRRRKEEVAALRRDLEIVDVRGNIEERIALVDEGRIDALIVAHAALIRLGLENRIAQLLPLDMFATDPRQGSLSIVMRKES